MDEKMEELVEREVKFFTEARVIFGPGLPPEKQEFVTTSHRMFPEFIWKWTGLGNSTITVNLIRSDADDVELETEDYLTACGRIVCECFSEVDSKNIPETRKREFVAFAMIYAITVRFREVAELPREVIRRIHDRVFSQ